MTHQCPSFGGNCKKSGCERENATASMGLMPPKVLVTQLTDDKVDLQKRLDAALAELAALELIYDAFRIGKAARTPETLLMYVSNAFRRSDCLSAIESSFFMVPTEPDDDDDGEPGEECLLNWGHERAEYVETFGNALKSLYYATANAPGFDLVKHLNRQIAFSQRTFGPGQRTAGVLDHIRKELIEIEEKPTDLTEWVDLILLAFDGAWRAGHTAEAICQGIDGKQTTNEGRTWPDWRTVAPGKAIEHLRSAQPAATLVPNMFWNNDDAEKQYGSIDEFLNDEICNGNLEVGDVKTVQRGVRLPNIDIKVTAIDDEECEAEWEVVSTPATQKDQTP